MKKRIAWLDNLKFIGIISVILGHIIGFWNENRAIGADAIQALIVSFNMPLFFMISGFTYGNYSKVSSPRGLVSYIKKVSLRLLLPSLAAVILLRALGLINSVIDIFWFCNILWRILVVFSISVFLSKSHLLRNLKWGGYLCLCLCLGNRTSEFALYFLLGLMIKQRCLLERTNWKSIAVLFAAYCIVLPFSCRYNFYHYGFYDMIGNGMGGYWIFRQIAGMSLCFVLMWLTYKLCRQNYYITEIGTMTLGLYIIHSIYVVYVAKNILHIAINENDVISWTLILLGVIGISLLSVMTVKILRLNKYTKYVFLGES